MADTGTGTEGTEESGSEDTDKPQAPDTATADEVAKWKAMARKHEAQAKSNAEAARKLGELEDANKSDLEKANAAAADAARRAEAAEAQVLKYRVAADKAVPSKLMKFLSGSTQEELEESADELLAALTSDTGDAGEGTGRPQERLRAGAANDAEPEESDPAKLAEQFARP